jgi:hypothetical protein
VDYALFVWLISQQYFSLRTNQAPATSQQYFSLRTNQHQPSATILVKQHHHTSMTATKDK